MKIALAKSKVEKFANPTTLPEASRNLNFCLGCTPFTLGALRGAFVLVLAFCA